MVSHQRCKNCFQRKGMSEQTMECPSRLAYGHDWEIVPGNGISWNKSLVDKLWKTKFGKVINIIAVLLALLLYK